MELRRALRDALALLDKDDFVLGIQDVSFPGDEDEDIGRGTPYSRGAERFLDFAGALGFTGIQLGPQGLTHVGSASPYEGTLFSRNPLNLPLARLVERGLLSAPTLDALRAGRPAGALERSAYDFAFAAYERVKEEVFATYRGQPNALRASVDGIWRRYEAWLLRDALYDALCEEHRRPYWRDWPPEAELDRRLFAPQPGEEARAQQRIASLRRQYAATLERHALLQLLLDEEHRALRARTRSLGLALFGDLQIGYSARDAWAYQALLLDGYRMGAPPSRTNPDGQPWGYELLDPTAYGTASAPGPALAFVRSRIERMLDEYDGVRIDHPHGWVCPWVYRADDPDAFHAVQTGARLFSSPQVLGHEQLWPFAIALPEQLRRSLPRHADEWVAALEPDQVDRYALLVDAIVAAAAGRGLPARALACEVLSTLPYPVHRVLQRHGLGRFRVTQKASPTDHRDVYRAEHAERGDWIMLGNHDTPPIWRVVDRWAAASELKVRAEDVAARLEQGARARELLASELAASPRHLVQALLADALASRARHVYVFFADLFGMRESFNTPGTVSEANWSLRAPHDFEEIYRTRSPSLEALNLPVAFALALRARGGDEHLRLARALDALSPLPVR